MSEMRQIQSSAYSLRYEPEEEKTDNDYDLQKYNMLQNAVL